VCGGIGPTTPDDRPANARRRAWIKLADGLRVAIQPLDRPRIGLTFRGRALGPDDRLEADTTQDWQGRVAWKARIGGGALTQAEDRASRGLDPAGVAAGPAQTGWLAGTRPSGVAAGRHRVAERVGFEPTGSCDPTLFKSAAFNRSATSPVTEDISGDAKRRQRPFRVTLSVVRVTLSVE
jgi:hypothetical protein